jgi:hypothetical protein
MLYAARGGLPNPPQGSDEARHIHAQERQRGVLVYLLGIVSEPDVSPVIAIQHGRSAIEVSLLHSHIRHLTPCSRTPDFRQRKSYVRSMRARRDHCTTHTATNTGLSPATVGYHVTGTLQY